MDELFYLEICEISKLIQRGDLSPISLTKNLLERINSHDRDLHAFATVTMDLALQQAHDAQNRLDRRQYLGPLHGIPIALKDLCYTKGVVTAAGMPLHRNHVPNYNGTAVQRLQNAGAILLGKLQLTEGAFTEHHPDIEIPVNPWSRDTWSGASSTGSGVAVAAGLCFAATGSDTGGSIRFPSAANGVTGLKPSWGRVSVYGAFELAASLDHLGPMARSATDCGILLQEMAGADVNDPRCAHRPVPNYLAGDPTQLRGVRIGVDDDFNTEDVDDEMRATVKEARVVLSDLGAEFVSVKFPDYRDAIADWGPICAIEAAYAHRNTFPSQRQHYGPTLADLLDSASNLSAADYQGMLLRRYKFRGQLEHVLNSVDCMLIPAQTNASPTIAQMATLGENPEALAALIRFTAPIDISGHPAITLPSGFTPRNTPVAIQLIAKHFAEDNLIRAGRAYQSVTDWHRARPTL
ncbi:MAG: amidase [Granulosicoccus sp.]|jgi:amidase